LKVTPKAERPLGRSRHRWEDNIKMDLKDIGWEDLDWIYLPWGVDQWWAAMNLQVK
jgi:hypothetical protein